MFGCGSYNFKTSLGSMCDRIFLLVLPFAYRIVTANKNVSVIVTADQKITLLVAPETDFMFKCSFWKTMLLKSK